MCYFCWFAALLRPSQLADKPPKTAAVDPPVSPKPVERTNRTCKSALSRAVTTPAPLAARAIGFYARGCLAGAVSLPINGPDWQVMRLSRNRNWGHPRLLDFLERFANDARALDGWPGLLVGDMSQPRGGPMVTGHASHQIGLDVDIWLTPMPDRILTPQERENMIAVSMLKDPFTVDPDKWSPLHTKLIKRAASIQRSTASSCIPPSRKCCASRQAMIVHGWPRCDHGGTTITIFMCGLAVCRGQATVKVKSP